MQIVDFEMVGEVSMIQEAYVWTASITYVVGFERRKGTFDFASLLSIFRLWSLDRVC